MFQNCDGGDDLTAASPLLLPERLGLGAVDELHKELLERRADNLTVDARHVSHIGTLCLQLLIAAAKEHKANGTTFRITNMGDSCVHQLSLFGLSPERVERGLE